jgi:hypothetical protein
MASDRQSIGSLSITACLLHPSDIIPCLSARVSRRLSKFTAPIDVPSCQICSRIAVPQTQICRPVQLRTSLSSHYSSPASCLLTPQAIPRVLAVVASFFMPCIRIACRPAPLDHPSMSWAYFYSLQFALQIIANKTSRTEVIPTSVSQ